jgi:DNA-binding XRE family transcriptional regulator
MIAQLVVILYKDKKYIVLLYPNNHINHMLDSVKSSGILKNIGANLLRNRTAKKLSMRGLAQLAEVEYSQIDRIEKGKLNCTVLTIIAIAEALEVPVSELFE